MTPPLEPVDEAARLDALRSCGVLDTAPEVDYDGLTRLAAAICGVPIALVSLVDRERQWFKSRFGLAATETPRDISFCGHTILTREPLVVPDAAADERFRTNPLVTGDPRIRFYAGVPLTDGGGHNLGSLCVIDRVPRNLTDAQRDALATLARQVVLMLQSRRQVAQLKRAQADVAVEQERFRAFMDNSPALSFMKDEDGRFVYVSKPVVRRFGIPEDQWLGRTDADLWPENVARALRDVDQHVLVTGETVSLYETVPTPDGESFHWHSFKFPFTDSSGRRFLAGMAVDRTAEARAAEVLRASEERFRSVVEELADGVVLLDRQTRAVLRCNRAFRELLDYTAAEAAALTQYDFVDHDPADVDEKMALIGRLGRANLGFRKYRRRDGAIVNVDVSGSLLTLDGREALCLVVQDMTEQVRAANALAASEAKFRNTVDRLGEGVYLIDAGTKRFVDANAALLAILGYTLAEFVGLDVFDIVAGETRDVYARNVQSTRDRLDRDGRCDIGRRQLRRKDGSAVLVDLRVTAVPDGGAGLHCVIVRDVTEQAEYEDRLFRYQCELEEANARLRALATTDGLTGVKNRAAFNEKMAEEYVRAARHGHGLSVILMDVDHFKLFNDAFGHPAGDEVLKAVAETIRGTTRTTDMVARYGGEEFAVVLPDTDFAGAMVLAERCRRAVAGVAWDRRPVTVSVGVATRTAATADAGTLIREADEALYRSKQAGRNRVNHGSGTVPFHATLRAT